MGEKNMLLCVISFKFSITPNYNAFNKLINAYNFNTILTKKSSTTFCESLGTMFFAKFCHHPNVNLQLSYIFKTNVAIFSLQSYYKNMKYE
jgi:hypothetical protein